MSLWRQRYSKLTTYVHVILNEVTKPTAQFSLFGDTDVEFPRISPAVDLYNLYSSYILLR